jgi:acyl dehydratase
MAMMMMMIIIIIPNTTPRNAQPAATEGNKQRLSSPLIQKSVIMIATCSSGSNPVHVDYEV